ncbi:hypothetical protein E2C01_060445 [Portunus trituberculatus]|uniref:Uncharacterized protein n=1 Tax=Portunus trituberculatus TaxID=210409 RepID=A0A5B7HBF5_PORTR|nr:hypothetical protein [Portunus trituberculatus]
MAGFPGCSRSFTFAHLSSPCGRAAKAPGVLICTGSRLPQPPPPPLLPLSFGLVNIAVPPSSPDAAVTSYVFALVGDLVDARPGQNHRRPQQELLAFHVLLASSGVPSAPP